MVYDVMIRKASRLNWPYAFSDTIVYFWFRPEGSGIWHTRFGRVFIASYSETWRDDMMESIKDLIRTKSRKVADDIKVLVGKTFKVEV